MYDSTGQSLGNISPEPARSLTRPSAVDAVLQTIDSYDLGIL